MPPRKTVAVEDIATDWRETLDTPEPGLYPDIPEDTYHASKTSLSSSGAKVIVKSPATFKWRLENPEPFKREYDDGSAAHQLVLGVGPGIEVLAAPDGTEFTDRRTNAYKAAEKAARDAGKIPLLRKQMAVVEAMAEKLREHRQAMELLTEGQPEVSAYAVDDETGVVRRGRFDWLTDYVLVDYKSTVAGGAHPRKFGRVAMELGYYQQAPWYLDIARDLGHEASAFAFIVQEKEPPYEVTVIELPKEAMTLGRDRNREALQRFRDCMDTDLWPSYVPDNQIAVAQIPAFYYYDDEVETS